jgi:hypothetical protein
MALGDLKQDTWGRGLVLRQPSFKRHCIFEKSWGIGVIAAGHARNLL